MVGTANASELNIDFGDGTGTPTSTFSGAGGQAGFWNPINQLGLSILSDLNGNPQGATLNLSADTISGKSGGTATDIQNLVNDNFFSLDPTSWSVIISGIDNGLYDIVYYSPSNDVVETGEFTVNGVMAASIFNVSVDTTSLVLGDTHSVLFDIVVENETLSLLFSNSPNSDFAGLAGLQLTNFRDSLNVLYCIGGGFQPPFDIPSVLKKKTRKAIPVRMLLEDGDGMIIADNDITAPPVVNVLFSPAEGSGDVLVTDELLPLGQANDDNIFRFDDSSLEWIYNLGSKPFMAPGIYTVTAIAGDSSYEIDSSCTGTFERLE